MTLRESYLAITPGGVKAFNTAKYAAREPGVQTVYRILIDEHGVILTTDRVGSAQRPTEGLTPAEIACLLRGEVPA